MNNRGFAITTILYGLLILFLMLLMSLLGMLSTYKDRLSLLIEGNNGARDIINGSYINLNADPPTCTLSASGTTITATISNINELVYYGWDSSYSGDNSTTTTISGAGTYSYYVLDSAGKTGVCRGTVEDMIETTTQVCNYSEDSGGCYYNSTSALFVGGSCRCKNGSSTGTQMTNGNCGSGRTCTCPTGYGIYSNSCTVSCSSGFVSSSGTYCKVYTSYSTTTTYSCSEGSTKLNDSYCWTTE